MNEAFTMAASSWPNIGTFPQREILRTRVEVLNFLGSEMFYLVIRKQWDGNIRTAGEWEN